MRERLKLTFEQGYCSEKSWMWHFICDDAGVEMHGMHVFE